MKRQEPLPCNPIVKCSHAPAGLRSILLGNPKYYSERADITICLKAIFHSKSNGRFRIISENLTGKFV